MAFSDLDRNEYANTILRYNSGLTKSILESPCVDNGGKGTKKTLEEFQKKNSQNQGNHGRGQNGRGNGQNGQGQNGQGYSDNRNGRGKPYDNFRGRDNRNDDRRGNDYGRGRGWKNQNGNGNDGQGIIIMIYERKIFLTLFSSEKPHWCPVHKKCYHQWSECNRNAANGGDVTLDNKNGGQSGPNQSHNSNNQQGNSGKGGNGQGGNQPQRKFFR